MRLLIKSKRSFTYGGVKPCSCWAATAVNGPAGLTVAACCCRADSAETETKGPPVEPVNPVLDTGTPLGIEPAPAWAMAAKFLC